MSTLADRMKGYEGREAKRRALPRLPVIIRLDGKNFSKWTKGLARPFDARMSELMIEVTKRLVEATGAVIGYTQSDEITLILRAAGRDSALYCDGRFQKLCSISASMAAVHFNALLPTYLPEKGDSLAFFDSRVWEVPNLDEAVANLIWRERDATKNSISMAARALYSHKALQGKNGSVMQDMLMDKGVNWNDYPPMFKRGTYVQRRTSTRKLTAEEIALLPPKHSARTNPDLVVTRSSVEVIDMPPVGSVANLAEVVFDSAAPLLRGE
jgi:tRNA(His) 5'-end guanylyltransferase